DDVNAIIMRDTPEKIRLAEKILEANDRRKAEVMFDVEILEVDRTRSLQLGWNFNPPSASISIHPPASATATTGEITLNQLQNITDDLIFFTIPSIVVHFFKQESDAKTLANPRVRVIDGKTAKINIGDRVPILLSTTTTAAAAVGTVPTTSSATSVEYKDTGIKLNAEPDIHLAGDMTLKLGLEVTSLGDAVDLGGGIKQFKFGTRTADTILNVRDGETVVIGGLIRDEDRKTVNKVPGLGDIPLLGKLFQGIQTDKVKVDVLMTLTPHIVHGMEIPNNRLQSFWSGTEESYSTRPLFSDLSVVDEGSVGETSSDGMFPAPPLPGKGGTSSLPGAALPAKISIQPSDATVPVNGDMTLEVKAENIRGAFEGRFSIAFDPNLLRFESGTEGELLLSSKGKPATFTASSKPGSGIVEVQIGRSDPEGIRGSGSLFKLAFKALHAGSSRIDFKGAQLTDKGKMPLAADAVSGFITVK
ncbi:MAG TPA: cohesin domain-containing protein, partial [Nitrospiria bacterium]|nr:cohesin domain-containing protein [Nitrospiria bacterium]